MYWYEAVVLLESAAAQSYAVDDPFALSPSYPLLI